MATPRPSHRCGEHMDIDCCHSFFSDSSSVPFSRVVRSVAIFV